jgi:hypothetical protein
MHPHHPAAILRLARCALTPPLPYACVQPEVPRVASLQAFSTMAHEAIMHARTMGYPAVFTDHSLFGFADASSILVNKVTRAAVMRRWGAHEWGSVGGSLGHCKNAAWAVREAPNPLSRRAAGRQAGNPNQVSGTPDGQLAHPSSPDPVLRRPLAGAQVLAGGRASRHLCQPH